MNNNHTPVIIIGAGIAGLTAAWHLQKMGIQTLILEANDTVGGRMQSMQMNETLIDYGAQFLSSAYTIIPNLINETSLTNEYIEIKNNVGLVNNRGVTVFQPQKPWQLYTKNVLSLRGLISLGVNQFKIFNLRKQTMQLNDITYWQQYDNELASDWVIKNFGKEASDKLFTSIFNGFYFQSLNSSSAAMAAAVLAFSAYHPKTMALTSGMGSLPQKLANKLNVKTNVTVSSIIETSRGIKIISNSEEFTCTHVIVTVPAPVAKDLIKKPDKESFKLFRSKYSSSILISVFTNPNWIPPSNITKAYGFLYDPKHDSKIAAIAIENSKRHEKEGFIINIMLADEWSKKMIQLSDEEIYKEVQLDVENILPDIFLNYQIRKIFRWNYAMPYTPIGRAKAVNEYRETRNEHTRIWLAGDYLGLPWTDSAAQTGLWAAKQVHQRMVSD